MTLPDQMSLPRAATIEVRLTPSGNLTAGGYTASGSGWICPAGADRCTTSADVAASYAIRRHATGGGRKDIVSLGQADERTISAFVASLAGSVREDGAPYRTSTVVRMLSSVRSLYRFELAEGAVAADPTEGVHRPKQPRTLPRPRRCRAQLLPRRPMVYPTSPNHPCRRPVLHCTRSHAVFPRQGRLIVESLTARPHRRLGRCRPTHRRTID